MKHTHGITAVDLSLGGFDSDILLKSRHYPLHQCHTDNLGVGEPNPLTMIWRDGSFGH